MDPFSITVGVLGITQAAISSIVTLHDQINSVKEAQQVVSDISADLRAVQRSLDALEEVKMSSEETYSLVKEDLEKTGVVEAVNNCGKASADFSKRLIQWTKHSSASRLSLRDHLSIGIWNKEKLGRFRSQVQSCRANVHFAVQSTQLLVQLRNDRQSAMDRRTIEKQLRDLEITIRDHIEVTKSEQSDVQKRRTELENEDERYRLLEADQVSAGIVFAQVHKELTGQEISHIITTEESKAVVGLPATVVGKINQRIHDVQTTGKSTAVVGVYDGDLSMQDIFKK